MTAIAEASQLLRQLAEPAPIGDRVKSAVGRAEHRLSIWLARNGHRAWSSNRVCEVFRGTDTRLKISAEEMAQLRGANAAKNHGIDRDLSVGELRMCFAELAIRIQKIDPEFDTSSIAGLREATLAKGDAPHRSSRSGRGDHGEM